MTSCLICLPIKYSKWLFHMLANAIKLVENKLQVRAAVWHYANKIKTCFLFIVAL